MIHLIMQSSTWASCFDMAEDAVDGRIEVFPIHIGGKIHWSALQIPQRWCHTTNNFDVPKLPSTHTYQWQCRVNIFNNFPL
jgi:hypothetical protein